MSVRFADGHEEAFPEANNILCAADGSLVLSYQSQTPVRKLTPQGYQEGLEIVSDLVEVIAVSDGWRRVSPLHERIRSEPVNGAADAPIGEEVTR